MSGLCCYPWIGVAAGLLGSIAINTGNNLQSLGMQNLEIEELEKEALRVHTGGAKEGGGDSKDGSEAKEIDPKESKVWVIGTTVFVTGSLLNFASYSLAPQSLLASLESIQFVTNVIFGKFVLGKEVTGPMYLGTFLTVFGTVLAIVFSAPHGAEINNVQDMINLWKNPAWIAYIAFIGALGFGLNTAYNAYDAAAKANTPFKNSDNVMAVLYSVYSALFGSTSVVFAKLLAGFVTLMTEGLDVSGEWFFYVTFFAWFGLMLYWLKRLNDALALYDPLFIIPLLQANFIFFAIISGGIFYQEFDYMTSTHWVGFTFGIAIIFSGLYFLAPADEDNDDSGGVSKPSESGRNVRKNSLMELEMHEMTSSVRGGHASGNNNDDDYSGHDDGIVSNGSGNNSPTSGGGEDDNVEDIMKQMFKAMSKTASVGEGLTVASAQKRATKIFMSGAAQMNHHTNRMKLIKQRKETELIRLMSQKTALSPADTEKAKLLMGQIKLVDQSLDLTTTFETLVKDDGTMSSENAATFKDHVMTFQEKSKIELQRTSSVGGGFDADGPFRGSMGSLGGSYSFFSGDNNNNNNNGNNYSNGGMGGHGHSKSAQSMRESRVASRSSASFSVTGNRPSNGGRSFSIFGGSSPSGVGGAAAAAAASSGEVASTPPSPTSSTSASGGGGAAAASSGSGSGEFQVSNPAQGSSALAPTAPTAASSSSSLTATDVVVVVDSSASEGEGEGGGGGGGAGSSSSNASDGTAKSADDLTFV